mmetsp:Transcript_129383/g.335486  ORF Transcript_129383/g.335486 Transcript_129383/m.335486 type:complete len:261 (+) Transcript_129383:1066-1848(+)
MVLTVCDSSEGSASLHFGGTTDTSSSPWACALGSSTPDEEHAVTTATSANSSSTASSSSSTASNSAFAASSSSSRSSSEDSSSSSSFSSSSSSSVSCSLSPSVCTSSSFSSSLDEPEADGLISSDVAPVTSAESLCETSPHSVLQALLAVNRQGCPTPKAITLMWWPCLISASRRSCGATTSLSSAFSAELFRGSHGSGISCDSRLAPGEVGLPFSRLFPINQRFAARYTAHVQLPKATSKVILGEPCEEKLWTGNPLLW